MGAAGSWLFRTCSLPWVTNAVLGGTWTEPCPAAAESKKLPNRLLLPAGPKGAEFGGFPEMKLSEILTPNVRTEGQAGRGVGPGPCPGVCSFVEGPTSGQVSGLRTFQQRPLLAGTHLQEVTGHSFGPWMSLSVSFMM